MEDLTRRRGPVTEPAHRTLVYVAEPAPPPYVVPTSEPCDCLTVEEHLSRCKVAA